MDAERWRQISQLYDAALLTATPGRAAFVREACGGDELLQREVESLLARDGSAQNFLNAPAVGAAASLMTDVPQVSLIGRQLGAYRVDSLLGAGGMGEVYRARDTTLGRDVAIKILPRLFTADPERLARFEREARMLAALNHPHVGAIYGVEDADGLRALILELVEGETLADRLQRDPVPVAEALTMSRQIADALEAAHEKGIVHRDLKPANIKVTPDGVVKVLDFGLAKAAAGDGSTHDLSQSPTVTVGGTREGIILGTAAYMSPEQARGHAVDKRTDIWAFGCVVYEMLTGRTAFAGETASDTIAAILEREPDWSRVPASTPAAIHRLMQRCLQKNARRRLRDIGDARMELDDALSGVAQAGPIVGEKRRRWRRILSSAAVATSLIAISVVIWNRTSDRQPATVVNLQRITDFVGMEEHPAAAPDGKSVAFVAQANGRRQVWVRLLAGGAPLQVTRDEADHEHPRWAPDSSSLIYFSGAAREGDPGTLWETSAFGGTARRIASSQGEADISHDGRRIATFRTQDNRTVLAILERDGSKVERVKQLPALAEFGSPRWSPDDRWIAFVGALEIAFSRAVFVINAADGEPKAVVIAQSIQGLAWLPDGSGLVYASSAGSTMTYPPTFNLRTVSRDGGPEQQLTFGDVSYVQPDIVAAGRLFASRVRMQSDIWRFPVAGTPADNVKNGTRITQQTGQVQTPSASPDGNEVVYLSDSGGHGNVWAAKVDGSSTRQITFERDPAVVIGIPVWSPAGDRIVMIQSRAGKSGEWVINPDGSGLRELVPGGAGAAWSGDGRWLYYRTSPSEREPTTCIEKIPIDGGSAVRVRCEAANSAVASDGSAIYYSPRVSTQGEIRKAQPENGPSQPFAYVALSRIPFIPQGYVLSPDNRWLTMPLKDAGTTNIWAFPTDGGPTRQLTDFGHRPILIARQVSWSPDGKFIYAAVVETDADIVLLDGTLR
jgi:serine/threonine protein kinase/Tol biopolymer transport system component